MNINNKKLIIAVLTVVAVVVAATVVLLSLGNGTQGLQKIHISIRPTKATPVSIVSGEAVIGNYNSPEIDIELSSETKFITIVSPTYKDKVVEIESDYITVTLEPKDNISTEDLIIDSVSDVGYLDFDNNYTIQNPRTYGNNEWIYGVLVEKNVVSDGEQVVIKIDGENKKVVFGGTDFTSEDLVSVGVPQQIAIKIVEDSRND
jgi:hypothetical protein